MRLAFSISLAAAILVVVLVAAFAHAAGIWHGAGWYVLIALAWPAATGLAVWRGWGD
jgi:hypothetical protein